MSAEPVRPLRIAVCGGGNPEFPDDCPSEGFLGKAQIRIDKNDRGDGFGMPNGDFQGQGG